MARPTPSPKREPHPIDLDELHARVAARVAERRAAGEYPPGLEEELEEHFRRIVRHRVVPDDAPLRALMDRLAAMPAFSPKRIPTSSRLPGGSALHATVARVVARQTTGVLEQVQQFANDVRDLLGLLVERVGSGETHVHEDLLGLLDAALERVSSYERAPAQASGPLRDLHRRLEDVERSLARVEGLLERLVADRERAVSDPGGHEAFPQAELEPSGRGDPDGSSRTGGGPRPRSGADRGGGARPTR